MSSAWLDVDYGIPFKQLLLRDYNIYGIVMSEGRFFEDALVKSVLLFAQKGRPTSDSTVRFIRIRGDLLGYRPLKSC